MTLTLPILSLPTFLSRNQNCKYLRAGREDARNSSYHIMICVGYNLVAEYNKIESCYAQGQRMIAIKALGSLRMRTS